MTKNINLLGKVHLDGIPPAPRGVPQMEVAFDSEVPFDSAQDYFAGKSNHTSITNEKDNNSLGNFHLDGLPPAPRGVPQIDDDEPDIGIRSSLLN